MSQGRLAIVFLLVFTLGVLVGAWLSPQVVNMRWQMEFARVQSEFSNYAQQVQPAIQMYNKAMQEQAPQGPETPQEAQQ